MIGKREKFISPLAAMAACVLSLLLPGCVQTGMGNAMIAAVDRSSGEPAPRMEAYTKVSQGSARTGKLIFNASYQDVALSFIKSGKGILEPVYDLKLTDGNNFDLVPDWEATRELHKSLSATMTLAPLEDTRTYSVRQLEQIKRQQAEWLRFVRESVRTEITGRSTVSGADVLALLGSDKKEQRRVVGGGIAGQLWETADPSDKSPYAAPYYSNVLKDFNRAGTTFVVSPSFELITMHQSLNLRLGTVAAAADVLGDRLAALQRYSAAGGGLKGALASGGRTISQGPLTMVTGGVSNLESASIVGMSRMLSGMAMRLHWYAQLSGERTALAFMSVENFRGVEEGGGRLNASLDSGPAENLVATVANGYNVGSANPFLDGLKPVPVESRQLYDITQLTAPPVPKPDASMFGPVDWSKAVGFTFQAINALCGTVLNCVDGGPAEKQGYVQLVAIGTNPAALGALRTAGDKAPSWRDFFECDRQAPQVSILSRFTDEAAHAIETASCHFAVALRSYGETASLRRQKNRELTRVAVSTFANARRDLKIATGLRTRPLD